MTDASALASRRADQAAPKAAPPAAWHLWRDGAGRSSPLRIVVLLGLCAPIAIAVYDYSTVGFGARPLNDVIHRTGYWALLFVMIALAITPLRRIARFNLLADVRRMIGVGAFAYAAAHFGLFVADQMFDLWKVASEIVRRLYLTIGFIALLGLAALAATSTDRMVRKLGVRRWQYLHNLVYVIALLALIHFFQQTKADIWLPTFVAGLFGWMIGYRLIVGLRQSRQEPPAWMLLLLSFAVAALTFFCEAIGIALAFNAPVSRILGMAFEFDYYSIRPGWFVLGAGLIVTVFDAIRSFAAPVGKRQAR